MSQVLITIVAPIEPGDVARAEEALDRMGNPADIELAGPLSKTDAQGNGIHFMSLHALPSFTAGRAHLVLEFSADGTQQSAITQIVDAIGSALSTVFALATDRGATGLALYLNAHVIQTGFGIGQSPGVGHSGNPGMTVGRIRDERTLANAINEQITRQKGGMTALERLNDVRAAIREDFGADTPYLRPIDAAQPFEAAGLGTTIGAGLFSFARTFLWPILTVLVLWIVAAAFWSASQTDFYGEHQGGWLRGAWFGLKTGIPVLVFGLTGLTVILYAQLRKQEETDWISHRAPDRNVLNEIVARENAGAQNHMVSLTELKAGWLRSLTARLVFWAIATIGPLRYKPGHLGDIGTIHYARWVTIPGTRDFIFFSNYGGSWEAYLEDFITLAHNGLTGVWSNTVGFPKTENLIGKGATDGERFKRYARQSMLPTRFWYSGYADLITDEIRANAAIRRGLSSAMTEDDAVTWLSHFGSTLRPEDRLVTSEIQSLAFGGLGFLKYSTLTLWKMPPQVQRSRAWLAEIAPHIAYNDGRRVRDDDAINAIFQVAFSSSGFAALGMPPEGLETFPAAFLDDMMHDNRARILGDIGLDAPENWWWGKTSNDVAVIVYGQTEAAYKSLLRTLKAIGKRHGATLSHNVDMKTFDPDDNLEPFGFVDGGSQPVIRGTYKGLKNADPLHLVEPGEFILGYPDNRGNLPPVPHLDALYDPSNELPVLYGNTDYARNTVNNMRNLGMNGSYLAIRQLEQDPEAFQSYCEDEAVRLKDRLAPPYRLSADFIAAKLVGRWRNGSPIVRAPYSASKSEKIISDNSFELGLEDPEGLRCPFGAHIRRANPRDSLNPGSMEQVAISNRHRMLRIGRKYEHAKGAKPGLLFMCLNGDLERQFEFIQQTWIHGNVISLSCPITLSGEGDPLLGRGDGTDIGFTVPTRDGPVKLEATPRFITMRGGGYFFMAGKRLVTYLSRPV